MTQPNQSANEQFLEYIAVLDDVVIGRVQIDPTVHPRSANFAKQMLVAEREAGAYVYIRVGGQN